MKSPVILDSGVPFIRWEIIPCPQPLPMIAHCFRQQPIRRNKRSHRTTAANQLRKRNWFQVRTEIHLSCFVVPVEYTDTCFASLTPVTVPKDVSGGKVIHVAHPDGSGRLIRAEVPPGLKSGNIFYVKAPKASAPLPPKKTSYSPAVTATPMPAPAKPSNPPSPQQQSPVPSVEAYPIYGDHIDVTTPPHIDVTNMQTPPSSPPPFSHCLDEDFPNRYTPANAPPPSPLAVGYQNNNSISSPPQQASSSGTRMVKVAVPPGYLPGSTIHVQVPGENRLIAAQIPPNCREFHVQYDPKEPVSPGPSSSGMNSPAMYTYQRNSNRSTRASGAYVPYSPAATSDHTSSAPHFPNTKLLSVKVPRGTPSGTALHVQVPGEPGRLLSARVPPGNVKEFHVSYVPRSRGGPVATSAARPRGERGSSAVLPIVGGVATGVAGAMMYDHFHHNNL